MIVLALALLAGSASAKLGDLVASFRNVVYGGPSYSHWGLAADVNYVYSFYDIPGWGYPIIKMRRSSGMFMGSYRTQGPSSRDDYRGVSYDGLGYLYYCNYSGRYVARARADNGSLLSTWTWPSSYRYGICVDHKGTSGGTYIYQTYYGGDFFKSRLTGSLVSSWTMPSGTNNYDLAWDYGNKLIWYANVRTEFIVAVDPDTRQIKTSFRHPKWASIGDYHGIAYWDKRLYVSSSSGTPREWIWVFDCPNTVGVAPASVGRIKALFE